MAIRALAASRSASSSVSAQIGRDRSRHPRRVAARRRLEALAVEPRKLGALRIDEVGERIGQAELGRPDRALRRRAEQPDLGPLRPAGQRRETRERVIRRQVVLEQREQLGELLGKVVRRGLTAIALQREHRVRVGSGRAADAEVDAAGMQRREHAEDLGHLERAVVRQHHAAAADADARRRGGDLRDQDLRRRAREHRRAVMLRDPVALVAERLGVAREIDRVAQRVGARRPLRDRRLVENAQDEGHRRIVPAAVVRSELETDRAAEAGCREHAAVGSGWSSPRSPATGRSSASPGRRPSRMPRWRRRRRSRDRAR